MTSPRTVLLADPQTMGRAGLRTILATAGFDVVSEAGDAADAVAGAIRHRPDICIVDAALPGGWLPAVRRIKQRVPEAVVVVSAPATFDDGLVVQAMLAGASGMLPANPTIDGLLRTIEAVLAGEVAVPRAAVARLIGELRGSSAKRTSLGGATLLLTARESQVLELVRDGLTTKQIAHDLGLSPVTVRRHVGSIAAKAGPAGRRELLERRRGSRNFDGDGARLRLEPDVLTPAGPRRPDRRRQSAPVTT